MEILDQCLARGIVVWGSPVSGILEDGRLFAQQARATDTGGILVKIMGLSLNAI